MSLVLSTGNASIGEVPRGEASVGVIRTARVARRTKKDFIITNVIKKISKDSGIKRKESQKVVSK